MPDSRMGNLSKNLRICCISKPHYNYFENEELLHEYYEKYRVPCSPNSISNNARPELFYISITEIFRTMPKLNFITDLKNCKPHTYANGNAVYYTSKKSASRLPIK